MKINSIKTVLLATTIVVGLSFQSCQKEGCTNEEALNYDAEAEKDDGSCELAPEVETTFTISSPEAHTTFMAGDTVHIASMYETTGEVHGYSVKITNTSDNDAVVFSMEEHAHESPLHIHGMWVNDVTMHSDMLLEISIETDHDGEEEEVKTISFHCHPMM